MNQYARIGWLEKQKNNLRESLDEVTQYLKEAHDQHVYAEDDVHEDDCSYCAAIKKAERILKESF